MVHHSLALDSGGSTDFGSVLVRLVSNESKSPTAFSEGRVRPEPSGNLEVMEDDDGRESSTSSAGTIVDDVVAAGPRIFSSLRCLPIV